MSSPHAAGSAILVRKLHPDWTVSETKSALMMTSFNGGTKEDGVTPWDADDVGTGRLDLTKAALAGLVMDETTANYIAANPSTGGDPKTLNIPSVRNMECTPSCSWTRTVRNSRTEATRWTATGNAITPGFNIEVSPRNFTFNGGLGETRELTITATPTTSLTEVAFGEVVLHESNGVSPDERLSVAIKGTGGGGGDIVLQAKVRRQQGKRVVELTWSPADGGNVHILRNGVVVGTTADNGRAQNRIGGHTGTIIYQVCETDSGDCSNEVRVRVRETASGAQSF
jgi:hypothetical protein